MPEARFDELIHAPHRLRICAMLSQADGIEFSEIQLRTDLSKSALSKHLSQLIDAAYVTETQILRSGRSRQLLSLTPNGRAAYSAHRAALQNLLTQSDETATATDGG